MNPTCHTGTSSPLPCSVCRSAMAEIRSDMGPVCRDCKAHLIHAENVLSHAGIPPQTQKNQSHPNT